MIDFRGPYRNGALFTAISGLLHLIAPVVSGFSSMSWGLAGVGLVCLAVAWGLLQGWRWLAYLAFLLLFIGISAAISLIWDAAPIPAWIGVSIAVADFLAVLSLFVALWKPRASASEA